MSTASVAAKQCLGIAREFAQERVQWGKPVGKHDAVAQSLTSLDEVLGVAAGERRRQLVRHPLPQLGSPLRTDLGQEERQGPAPHRPPGWKLQDEDWRNRERWDEYALATHEMIQQTSVMKSPWVLVENESKHYGRIKVINAVCDALEAALKV